MTMKSLLSTVSLALLLGGGSVAAQAQIAIGQLADYSGGTSDVGTPYGQGVADAFSWVNKNGGNYGHPAGRATPPLRLPGSHARRVVENWSNPLHHADPCHLTSHAH